MIAPSPSAESADPERPLAGKRLISFVFERVAPPETGLHVAVMQRLDCYAALGAEVHLVAPQARLPRRSFWPTASQEALAARGVRLHLVPAGFGTLDFCLASAWQIAVKKLGRVVWPRPDSVYYWRPQLMAYWHRLLRAQSFDLALVNYANWSRLLPGAKAAGARAMLEMHELQVFQFAARLKLAGRAAPTAAQIEAFRAAEIRCLQEAELILSVNEDEGRRVRAESGREVVCLPNGLPEPSRNVAPIATDILVVGSGIENNKQGLLDFLRGAWPEILRERPQTRLTVCGGVGEALSGAERNVAWIRFAPDLTPHYLGAAVVLLTTVAGAGIKIKALEAMAHGCCILAHRHSVLAFAFDSGVHGEVVDDLAAAAPVALSLLRQDARRSSLGAAAFALFRQRYGFDASKRVLGEAVVRLLQSPRAQRSS